MSQCFVQLFNGKQKQSPGVKLIRECHPHIHGMIQCVRERQFDIGRNSVPHRTVELHPHHHDNDNHKSYHTEYRYRLSFFDIFFFRWVILSFFFSILFTDKHNYYIFIYIFNSENIHIFTHSLYFIHKIYIYHINIYHWIYYIEIFLFFSLKYS